jgi:hypothetical protein
MNKNTIFISIISVLLFSCGKSKSSSAPYVDGSITLPEINVSEEVNAFDTIIAKTEISANAPEALSFLISRSDIDNEGLFTCSGFFIDSETVMTNSHCIPNFLKQNTITMENCKDHIRVITNTKDGIKKVACKKIIYFSEIDINTSRSNIQSGKLFNPDYAIFKVDQKLNFSQTFSLSSKGIEDEHIYLINSFNPLTVDDNIFGEFEQKRCVSKLDTIIATPKRVNISKAIPLFQDDDNNIRCNVIKGNSGSPIVPISSANENNHYKAVGAIYALSEEKTIDLKNLLGKRTTFTVNQFTVANNFSCLQMPEELNYTNQHSQCDQLEDLEKKKSLEANQMMQRTDLLQEIDEELKKDTELLPSIFSYAPRKNISDSIIVSHLEPACLKPLNTWTKEEKKFYLNKKNKMPIDSPEVIYFIDYDHFLEPYLRKVMPGEIETTYTQYLFRIKSKVKKMITIQEMSEGQERDIEIKVCELQ